MVQMLIIQHYNVGLNALLGSLIKDFVHARSPLMGVGAWTTRRAARSSKTYIKLNGKRVYLYRSVDKEGQNVDFLLRAKRDAIATKAFLTKEFKQHGIPKKVTIDKSGSDKSALDSCNRDLGKDNQMEIRQVKYLNNIVEQDHCFIKKRTRPTLGFKNFYSAAATIKGVENIRIIQKGQIFGCDSTRSVFHNFCALMA